jgi:uncharacterized protein YbjT (DUF2867 family)
MIAYQGRAIVLGATGAVGANIVQSLLASTHFSKVTTMGRRIDPTLDKSIGKLAQQVTDVFNPKVYSPLLADHTHAFCAFGIGQPSKSTPEEFQKVDIDAVLNFAKSCKESGISHFTVMTAVGANPKSSLRYLRLKGELERDIIALGFPRTSIFRPSMLITPTNRYGLLQGLLLVATPIFDHFLLGSLKRYRSITVSKLGQAMVKNTEKEATGSEILDWKGFKELA